MDFKLMATNIPSKEECFRLLEKYHFPQSKRAHVELVEKVAVWIAARCKAQGISIDLGLVSAGALLHDIDKGVMVEGDIHTVKGEKILSDEGYPELARICVTHRIDAFLDEKTKPSTWEEKCVALADKMATKEIITVDERFRRWNEEEVPEAQKEILSKSYPLVKELEKEILGIIGVDGEEMKQRITYQES